MSSVIEGSFEPVFKEESAVMSEDDMQTFKRAWVNGLLLSLEQRIAGGLSPEELTFELLDELGVDNFHHIIQHFFADIFAVNTIEASSS